MTTKTFPNRNPGGRGPYTLEIIIGIILFTILVIAGMVALVFIFFGNAFSSPALPTEVPAGSIPPTQPGIVLLPTNTADAVDRMTPTPTETNQAATLTPPPATQPSVIQTTMPICNYAINFVGDVTVPDDTIFSPGTQFAKIWRIQNSGNCAWESGTTWFFNAGDRLNGPEAVAVPIVLPGHTVDVAVNLTAPQPNGRYIGYWALRLPNGQVLNNNAFVRIIVEAPRVNTPTATSPVIYNWRGAYYNNTSLAGQPVFIRDDQAINFNWGTGTPVAGLSADSFSVLWTRALYLEAGQYRFHATMDDGMRVYLDNTLIIDSWRDGPARELIAEKTLASGYYNLRVEYYENNGQAAASFWWETTNAYPDWRGEYFSNAQLSGIPTLIRNDKEVNYNWFFESPDSLIPRDTFSARWTRQQHFPAGNYTFFAQADDGIRVYVDGRLLINEWHENDASRLYQTVVYLNGTHTLMVEYYENAFRAQVRFWYQTGAATATPTATVRPPTATPTATATRKPPATVTKEPPAMTPTSTATQPPPTIPPTSTATQPPPTVTPTETTQPPTATPTATATRQPPPATPTTQPQARPGLFNEILLQPGQVDWDGSGEINMRDQWFELANRNRETIDLSGWHIAHADAMNDPETMYQFPPNTILRLGQHLVFYRQQTGFAINPNGDHLVLINGRGKVVSQIVIPTLAPDASYSRDDQGVWRSDWPPTPGEPNHQSPAVSERRFRIGYFPILPFIVSQLS